MTLRDLGLDDWFEAHTRDLHEPQFRLARVVAIDRGRIVVHDGEGELFAELLGHFFYKAESVEKFPCVGDWVYLKEHDSGLNDSKHFASIHCILPRKNLLQRKTVGYNEEFQMLGANIDVAFIVMSCHYDFNVRKLERFLVMVHEANIQPVLLLTKFDLINEDILQHMLKDIQDAGIHMKILTVSNATGYGLDKLRRFIEPRKTYCLLGSSGVGKSSLMNQLIGCDVFETQEVSDSGQGKHTTVRRHLIVLEKGGMLVDMPGIRELAVSEVSEGIEVSFTDILELAQRCKFSNCSHSNEPDCAILQALEKHNLDAEHYKNYLKIKKESKHHKTQTAFIEKRKKAKNASRVAASKVRHRKVRYPEEDS